MTPSISPPSSELKTIAQAFREYVQATGFYPRLTAFKCIKQQGRLWLVAGHPAPEVNDPGSVLRELTTVFYEIMAEVECPENFWAATQEVPVRICLQLERSKSPYAIHTFTWRLEDTVGLLFDQADSLDAEAFEAAPGLTVGDGELGAATDAVAETSPEAQMMDAAIAPLRDSTIALPQTAIAPPPDLLQRWLQWGLGQLRRVAPYWSYGLAALILTTSGFSAYLITRPCVVGSCTRLEKAAGFREEARIHLHGNPTPEDFQEARANLQAVVALVEPIPSWSDHYGVAQEILQPSRMDLLALKNFLQAQGRAGKAVNAGQNPPHPVAHWADVHQFWLQAIGFLEEVPAKSAIAPLAQAKLVEYRHNATEIAQRMRAEEEAEANFNSALQAGQLAQQRTETAEALPGWQLAAQEWQAAMHGMSLVPKGTEVYAEAQEYLTTYREQFIQVQEQVNRENAAIRNHSQAIAAARQAATYETQNQWTQAVSQWKIAVASVQAIPPETTLADEAETFLATYQPALEKAQSQLRTAIAIQTLEGTLAQVCATSATPCQVNRDPTEIQITLASQYAEALNQAITPPTGAPSEPLAIAPEAEMLIEQIATLGKQIQRPIAIYDAHGGFIARYRPDLGGFIKH